MPEKKYDVYFYEIGGPAGGGFAVYTKVSEHRSKTTTEAQRIIAVAVGDGGIPDPGNPPKRADSEPGGRLDISVSGSNEKICVFHLNGSTKSYFYDREPILNIRGSRYAIRRVC